MKNAKIQMSYFEWFLNNVREQGKYIGSYFVTFHVHYALAFL